MIKPFIVEFLITVPLLVGISVLAAHLLKKQFGFKNTKNVAAIFSLITVLVVIVARAMPFLAFRIAPLNSPAAEQSTVANLKNEFLKSLDELIANPAKVTPDNNKAFFAKYKDLFPNGAKDRQIYLQNLNAFIDCNRFYFEDAIQALKSKKPHKSEGRLQCEILDGAFFGRAKLVQPEQGKLNDQIIETIAKGKKIIQDNKEVEINEGILKQALEAQLRNKETLKAIFLEAQ